MSKNKKQLIRIICVAVPYAAMLILHYCLELNFWLQIALFAALYLAAGYDVLYKAVRNLFKGRLFDENFLMAIATIGAFFIEEYADAVAVMLLYQTGELFQQYAVGKSRRSIADLMQIMPDTATVLRDGAEIEISAEEIVLGDVLCLKAGDKIAADGIVIEGEGLLDKSALTGESVPVAVKTGDSVVSGSIDISGTMKIETTAAFEDSAVSKILDLVENATNQKAPSENFITKFCRFYTPIVVIAAVILGVVPPIFDGQWQEWLKKAMMFLFVSCPCALVISVPLGFFGGIGAASKKGILVKGGNYLENLAKTRIFAFDKTGTLTQGKFAVQSVLSAEDFTTEEVLKLAAIAENGSNHPIALSIAAAYQNEVPSCSAAEYPGRGIEAICGSDVILCGNNQLFSEKAIETAECDEGTVVHVALNGKYAGTIVIADAIKENSAAAIEQLNSAGYTTVMLTGDNEKTAAEVAEKLGVAEYQAQLLPADKAESVKNLMKRGKTAFSGDGINDAPVLVTADVGIAMGAIGSDAAIEAADVVLLDDDPLAVPKAVKIAKKTMRIVKENITFALVVKFAVLILAATGLVTSLILAIFADVGVSMLAVLNSLRALKSK